MSKPCVRITMRYLNTRYLIVLKLLFLLLAVEDAFESVDIALQNSLCGRREHTFFHKKKIQFFCPFFFISDSSWMCRLALLQHLQIKRNQFCVFFCPACRNNRRNTYAERQTEKPENDIK